MTSSKGFTLLEVLIAMLVLAIALLGLAKLQAFSMKNTGNAYYKTQATLILNQAVEELRLNRGNLCAADWLQTKLPPLSKTLPGGNLTVAESSEACVHKVNSLRCTVTVAWTESAADLDGNGQLTSSQQAFSQKSISMSICR